LDGRTTRQEEQEQEQEERRFMEIVHSEYVSPASPRVLERWGHVVAQNEEPYYTCDIALPPKAVLSLPPITTTLPLTTLTSPTIHIPAITATSTTTAHAHRGLFSTFPRTLIVVGDAERLVREVASLVRAMERDGVEVRAEWVRDAVHDVLIVREGWWDERVRERVWGVVGDWVWGFGAG
jgi:hypothetical protein